MRCGIWCDGQVANCESWGGIKWGGGEGNSVGSDEERGYVLRKRYTGTGECNGGAAGDQGLAVEANLPAQTIKPGASPKPFEPAITADPQSTLSPSPVPKSASNGDKPDTYLTANKNLNANDSSAKELTIEDSPVSNDVPNAGLPSAAPDPASRTVPVVVEATTSVSGQIHDPNRAGIITDHSPPTLFPSANAARLFPNCFPRPWMIKQWYLIAH